MFQGSMVALVTPMHRDGTIDYERFLSLIDWHLSQGTHAIVVAGTTGESGTLTHAEKIKLIKSAVTHIKGRIPVIAGAHANSTQDAIEMARSVQEVGADAALVMTPAYIKPTQEGLFLHYQSIARSVGLPIIVYNVPSRTACDILPETLVRLCVIPNIVGIKEASGDIERFRMIKKSCPDLDIYSGCDDLTLDMILEGAQGVISVTANVAPKRMAQMCEAGLKGNVAEARSLNASLAALHHDLFIESNPIPTKFILESMSRIEHGIRLPLTPLSQDKHAILEPIVAQLMQES